MRLPLLAWLCDEHHPTIAAPFSRPPIPSHAWHHPVHAACESTRLERSALPLVFCRVLVEPPEAVGGRERRADWLHEPAGGGRAATNCGGGG